MNYIFVGEIRSQYAIKHSFTWGSGKSTAKFLFNALRGIGIEPCEQQYVNLYYDEGVLDEGMLDWLRETQTKPIVGMGKAVQKVLEKYNIPHIKIVHPAARGKYKRYEIYVQHLRERLRLP